jgi:hypothetical protein
MKLDDVPSEVAAFTRAVFEPLATAGCADFLV